MAIQFPPINPGDDEPKDGDTYLYLINQKEFVCRRATATSVAQWYEKGLISTTAFGYRGTIEILKPAPDDAVKGNMYVVSDGGNAHSSFSGIANDEIEQWSLILYDNPNWIVLNAGDDSDIPKSPWVRTSQGRIQPAVDTDNLDMEKGNYLINELDEL